MKFFTFLYIISLILCLPVITKAQTQNPDELMLNQIRRMRIKQQQEEIVIREQSFIHIEQENHCTPVQQARQRIRDVEIASGESEHTNVTINAGHESLDITDNHGTINSDVNIQILNQDNSRECL